MTTSNQLRHSFLKFTAFIIVFIAGIMPIKSVSAHYTNACGDGISVRWSGTSTTTFYPSTWPSTWKTAVNDAATAFSSSDFDYYVSATSPAQSYWDDLGVFDSNIAGQTNYTVNCTTHRINTPVYFYFNSYHFNTFNDTTAQKQCTAIHELGHGAGLEHNNQTSIMFDGHSTRCHSLSITTLQSHDTFDINSLY